MEIKNIFVKESDVNYLWSGFEKKLESLSALRSSSRVCAEAFDVSGLCSLRRSPTRVQMSGVILRAKRRRDIKTFSDALAVDLSQRRGGRNKITKRNEDLTDVTEKFL